MASKPPVKRRRKASDGARIRRKNLNIDQNKLDRLVELLGASSETEVIDQVLDDALVREELRASLKNIPRGEGELVNYFEGGWSDKIEER